MSSRVKGTPADVVLTDEPGTDSPRAVRLLAHKLGVRLYVEPGTDRLKAGPGNKVTPELRNGIKQHRDALIRDVVFVQAQRAVGELWPTGVEFEHDAEMAATWALAAEHRNEGTLEEHRGRLQDYVRAAQRRARELEVDGK